MITFDEINEQPSNFAEISKRYSDLSKSIVDFLKETAPSEIDFVGCGSSYNLAMGLSFQVNRLSSGKVFSRYFSGSEIAFGFRKFSKDAVLVGLSRSGESTETVQALKRAKNKFGIKTMAISCEPESPLTKVADAFSVLNFVDEKSVVMTKSFTSMAFLASALIRDIFKPNLFKSYLKSILESAQVILESSKDLFKKIDFRRYDHFAFLGYDEYLAAAMEGIIKVTETSLSDVSAFQTLEYRHGPKSKVGKESMVCIFASNLAHSEEEKMAQEIKSLGGTVVNVSSKRMNASHNLLIPYSAGDFGDWFLKVIPAQIIGVEVAKVKGLNPDNPKNLTRVVKF